MLTIDAVKMPVEVERHMTGGPSFYTTINSTANGVITPVSSRPIALHDWELTVIGLHNDTADKFMDQMKTFFLGRRGPAYGFLFKDWADYTMAVQSIGTGNGANKDFNLVKVYADSIRPYNRYITRPINLNVYKNGILQTLTTHYTFAGGVVSFVAAPAISDAITADCQFDVPVHFTDDKLIYDLYHSTQAMMPTFKIEEVNEYMQLHP